MWNTVLDLTLPLACPGCGGPEAWCAPCASTLSHRPRRVLVPAAIDEATQLPPVYALARYRGPVRAAILAAKERGRRDLPGLLGTALGQALVRLVAISVLTSPVWLVPAPTRVAEARRRGGDPITWMARSAALVLAAQGSQVGVAPCVFTAGDARDSVGLDAQARQANLRDRIRWRAAAAPPARSPVVLVDDVLTTGTTAACAVALLHARNHSVQVVLTLAAVPSLVSAGHLDHRR